MAENSRIEWTHHTFNPWSGCTKIGAGCSHCYAAALPPAMRRGAEWGEGRDRVPAGDAYWRQPLAWNRAAEKAGERHRVFCASVADVFEDRADLDPWRERMFALIDQTPALDWLLLTKRPQVALRYATQIGARGNIWLGTSVENQQAADERIPWLLRVPARVRFLSMEPLLGFVNICAGLYTQPPAGEPDESPEAGGMWRGPSPLGAAGLSWVIAGGESGRNARPMHPDWARLVRDQCVAAGVPFFFKQWGEWLTEQDAAFIGSASSPVYTFPNKQGMVRVSKHAAGRLLDGRTWDEVPR